MKSQVKKNTDDDCSELGREKREEWEKKREEGEEKEREPDHPESAAQVTAGADLHGLFSQHATISHRKSAWVKKKGGGKGGGGGWGVGGWNIYCLSTGWPTPTDGSCSALSGCCRRLPSCSLRTLRILRSQRGRSFRFHGVLRGGSSNRNQRGGGGPRERGERGGGA